MDFVNNEENNLSYSKSINGVKFTLTYKPTDLLVKQELMDSKDVLKIKEFRSKYNKHIYFNLSMSYNNRELLTSIVSNKKQFAQMINDLSFGASEKIHLFSKAKDTLSMSDFNYPRMYDTSKSTTILIVYPRDVEFIEQDYLNLTIDDLGFDTGEVRFKIDMKAIRNEPTLNLQKQN
ncbi:MAG: hypothetical protein H7239_11985 [Flavobacterium sp.]|nr:hypothetical protein [Flavobacterium sp.]